MTVSENTVAVLTGDIVKSTKLSLPEREALFGALKAGASLISELQGEDVRFERFSGDSWQMLLVRPALALRACLLLRAYIRRESKSFETRISVGVGSIEPLSAEGLGASDGVAFQASGRELKKMLPKQYFTANSPDKAVFILADGISQRWTVAQARVLALSLVFPRPTQETMAEYLGISRQSVGKHQIAAGEPALLSALAEIERLRSP